MNLLEDLPPDLITVLLDAMCQTSKVSIQVMIHVNKFWHMMFTRYARQQNIPRFLECTDIAAENSLELRLS